jgi:flagellar assembly factor FliW
MSSGGQAVIGQAVLASGAFDGEEVETRFGRVSLDMSRALQFPMGMLGMPDKTRYCLTHFPSEKMARFKLLQSLEDAALSFITLPVEIDNPMIERADIAQAAQDLGMALEDVLLLLVVTVQRESGVAQLSVNARAPLLVQVSRNVAAQYVFSHTKYLIRQPLAM